MLVIAHKIVSKAEGRIRELSTVEPGARARELAAGTDKDPRHVQVVLDESREVLRSSARRPDLRHPARIRVRERRSRRVQPPTDETLVLLPEDPDASARALRRRIRELERRVPGGPDHRLVRARLAPRPGRRRDRVRRTLARSRTGEGDTTREGRELRATWIAVADELAAAADLARTKDGQQPAVVLTGAGRHVTPEDGPGAQALIRPESEDLFR